MPMAGGGGGEEVESPRVDDPDAKHDRFAPIARTRTSSKPTARLDPAMIRADAKPSVKIALAHLELLGPWAVDAFRVGLLAKLDETIDQMLKLEGAPRADAVQLCRDLIATVRKIAG